MLHFGPSVVCLLSVQNNHLIKHYNNLTFRSSTHEITFLHLSLSQHRSQFIYIFKIKKFSFTNARNVAVKGEIAIK